MYLPRFSWNPRLFIDDTVLKHEGSRNQGRKLTYQALELGSNNFTVTLVAALGFFSSSYVLFTSSTVLPMLGFIYWHDATKASHEIAFNNATVAGTMVGMFTFGLLADIFGRRKMYGFELIILMLGTLGVVMSSTGYIPLDQIDGMNIGTVDYGSFGSMNIQSWLLFWKFVSGVGIGGEYPLSAVIASEFAPTAKRPRMLAIIFSMQALGITVGATVSLVATKLVQARHPYDPTHPEASARAVDQIWRWFIGLALIPAVLTAIVRFTIPESPRYTLDVLNDPVKAFQETDKIRRVSLGSEIINQSTMNEAATHDEEDGKTQVTADINDLGGDSQRPTIMQYFWIEGNWRYLFATAVSWFLVDFGTFALGLNEAPALSKFWNGPKVNVKNPKVWDSNTADPNSSIFSILIGNSVHVLAIESTSLLTGAVLLVLFITHLNRKMLTWVMFLVSSILFIITGVTLLKASEQIWGINTALYALCKFSLTFGIGPLTFMIPAELFPTRYRATCHGISAAFGKFGAVLASIFLRYVTFGSGPNTITPSSSPSAWLSYVMMTFAASMLLGAFVSWLWLPELQDSSGKSKTLEQLALGRRAAKADAAADSDGS